MGLGNSLWGLGILVGLAVSVTLTWLRLRRRRVWGSQRTCFIDSILKVYYFFPKILTACCIFYFIHESIFFSL